ncbi:MAG: hypothetical protein ACP5VQ_11750, partial [Phycisphaerae bacterium]
QKTHQTQYYQGFSLPKITFIGLNSGLTVSPIGPGASAPSSLRSSGLIARGDHRYSYFRFTTTPGLEPTNNPAEQAIRFVVLDRHVTQGTRSVFEFLYQTIHNHFAGRPTPSLLPSGP